MLNNICKKHFDKLRLNGWKLYLNKSFPTSAPSDLPLAGDFIGVRGPFERVMSSRFAKVYKCAAAFNGLKHEFYYKQFLCRSVKDFCKHIFRSSRAERSMKASVMLSEHNLNTPEVIAAGVKKLGPFPVSDFTLTRSIKDANSLNEYIDSDWGDIRERRNFITCIGTEIGRMHAAGISHGDLRPGNILITKSGSGYRFFFLDNERTRKHRSLPQALRIKNLVQINMFHMKTLSKSERMRFYKSYLKQNPQIESPKELARQVAQTTAQRLSKK